MTPDISIIILVYNAEPYVSQCIDSILGQSFTNYEIILIDDGSKDRSGEICDEYRNRDARIQVFHTENRGVSSARNLGIDKAQGRWITFVDADDFLENSYLNDLIVDSDGYGLVTCGMYCIHSKARFSPPRKIIDTCREGAALDRIIAHLYFTSAASKLYNANIIRKEGIRFDTHFRLSEDLLFLLKYLSKIRTIRLARNSAYCYRDNFQKIRLRYRLDLESYLYNSHQLQMALDELKKHNGYDFPYLDLYIKNNEIGHFYYHLFSLEKYSTFMREVHGFRKNGGVWYVNSAKKRPFVFLLKYFPRVAYWIIRIIKPKHGC